MQNIKIVSGKILFVDKDGQELSFNQTFSKTLKRMAAWIEDFSLFVVDSMGWCPFWTFRKFIYQLFGLKIGKDSKIHVGARFFRPDKVSIGEDTIVGEMAFLDGRAGIFIGNHVDIASGVWIYTSEHDISSEKMKAVEEKVEIGNYVFIGPRAIILPGVKIGEGAVVAAGAVVTKEVATRTIVGGVPAREIGKRQLEKYNYRLGRTRLFQ